MQIFGSRKQEPATQGAAQGVTVRAFCMGLEPGQSVELEIDGKPVTFLHEAAQVDIPTSKPATKAQAAQPTE
jgi:hypothetical protein